MGSSKWQRSVNRANQPTTILRRRTRNCVIRQRNFNTTNSKTPLLHTLVAEFHVSFVAILRFQDHKSAEKRLSLVSQQAF